MKRTSRRALVPTTAISADAPLSMTYSSETMAVVGTRGGACGRTHCRVLAEPKLHGFELREPALPVSTSAAINLFSLGSESVFIRTLRSGSDFEGDTRLPGAGPLFPLQRRSCTTVFDLCSLANISTDAHDPIASFGGHGLTRRRHAVGYLPSVRSIWPCCEAWRCCRQVVLDWMQPLVKTLTRSLPASEPSGAVINWATWATLRGRPLRHLHSFRLGISQHCCG